MLNLGGPETERPQLITYDPADSNQVKDARTRQASLERLGFTLAEFRAGEVTLNPPPKGPNIGTFRILSDNGDDRVVWDRKDPNQVREAFAKFKELIALGYKAFATLAAGKKGHAITEFDPALQEILFIPATQPG